MSGFRNNASGSSPSSTEDLAHTSGDSGVMLLAVRSDAGGSLVSTDGDYTPLSIDSSGNLRVSGSLSVGGTGDNSAFTAGTSEGNVGMGFYHATIDTVTDGRVAAIALTSKRSQHVTLHTAAGAETGVAAAPLQVSLANHGANATAVKVDGSAVTQPVSGTITADLGATDNAVLDAIAASVAAIDTDATTIIGHVDGIETAIASTNTKLDTVIGHLDGVEGVLGTIDADTGSILTAIQLIDDTIFTAGTDTYTEATSKGQLLLAVRRDADTTLVNTTNEFGPLQMDANGRLKVEVFSGETLPISGSITTVSTVTAMGVGTSGPMKAEDVAHATGDMGFAVWTVRQDTLATTAANGDYVPFSSDSVGALYTRDTATLVDDAAFTPATSRVLPGGFFADEASTDSVDEGDIGAARMTLDRKQITVPAAHTNSGATPYKLVSAASTNATSVKGSAGQIYSIVVSNVNAAVRYLKLYNKATAPTVGTDTPVHTLVIPGATTGGGLVLPIPVGMEFTTGIAFALTTEATDAGTTGVAASELVVNLTYK